MSIYEKEGELGRKLVERMDELTWDRVGEMALGNAAANLSLIQAGDSIAEIRDAAIGDGDSAIVIAAGPSIKRHDPIKVIIEEGYKGAIIATESGMPYCLRNGVVPDLVVTADPHPIRISRWFGEPSLSRKELSDDDYFRRQDMDEEFANEEKMNQQVLDLMDRYGKEIRIALSTTSSEPVVTRAHEIGMQIYWWNPMMDDPDPADSKTRQLYRKNRMPCINAGGNVGTAAWMMAHAVLGKKNVALTGMDFSYYGDTPYENTQYYYEAIDLVGKENLDSIYIRITNPHLEDEFYTDPAYMWYREAFLELVTDADCTTFNCTQGGILFGDGINFIPLHDFVRDF